MAYLYKSIIDSTVNIGSYVISRTGVLLSEAIQELEDLVGITISKEAYTDEDIPVVAAVVAAVIAPVVPEVVTPIAPEVVITPVIVPVVAPVPY